MKSINFPNKILLHEKDYDRFLGEQYDHFFYYYNLKYKLIKDLEINKIAEIGVRAGYSAYMFLQAHPEAKYYGFDNNQGKDGGIKGLEFHKHAEKILKDYDIHIRPDFNSQKAKKLIDEDGKDLFVDLVHVDGDHTYYGALNDLRLAKKAKAKWILIDDVLYINKVGHAVNDFLQENPNYKAEYFADFRGEMLICLK